MFFRDMLSFEQHIRRLDLVLDGASIPQQRYDFVSVGWSRNWVHDGVSEVASQAIEDWVLGEDYGLRNSSIDDFNLKEILLEEFKEFKIFAFFFLVGLIDSAGVSQLFFEFEENDDDVENGHHIFVKLATSNLIDLFNGIFFCSQVSGLHLRHEYVH